MNDVLTALNKEQVAKAAELMKDGELATFYVSTAVPIHRIALNRNSRPGESSYRGEIVYYAWLTDEQRWDGPVDFEGRRVE